MNLCLEAHEIAKISNKFRTSGGNRHSSQHLGLVLTSVPGLFIRYCVRYRQACQRKLTKSAFQKF
jgi:hypothetical protein